MAEGAPPLPIQTLPIQALPTPSLLYPVTLIVTLLFSFIHSSHHQDPLSQCDVTPDDHPEDTLCKYNIIHVKEEKVWVKDESIEPMDLLTGSPTTFISGSGGTR